MRFRKKTWRETSVEDLLMPNENEAEPAVLGKGDEHLIHATDPVTLKWALEQLPLATV